MTTYQIQLFQEILDLNWEINQPHKHTEEKVKSMKAQFNDTAKKLRLDMGEETYLLFIKTAVEMFSIELN